MKANEITVKLFSRVARVNEYLQCQPDDVELVDIKLTSYGYSRSQYHSNTETQMLVMTCKSSKESNKTKSNT